MMGLNLKLLKLNKKVLETINIMDEKKIHEEQKKYIDENERFQIITFIIIIFLTIALAFAL
jgi:penicillin-binding protein-related factor A (putative recombinase)